MSFDIEVFFKERFEQFKRMADISIVFLFFGLGWGLVQPIFNIRINEVTGSLFLSGIIFGMWGFVRLFTDIPVGILNDRFSTKKIIQITFLGYAVISLLYVYVNTFAEIFFLRLVHSMFGSLLWISTWTYTRRLSKGDHGSERVSIWMSVLNVPYIIGPLIGGLIITIFDWKLVFYLLSLFMFLSFLYASFKLKSRRIRIKIKFDLTTELRHFYKHRGTAVRVTILTILFFIITGIYGSYIPLFMQSRGFNIEQISIVLGLATSVPYLIFCMPAGLLGDKYGKRWPLFFGLITSGISLSLAFGIRSLFDMLLLTFTAYAGFAFISVSLNSKVTDLLPKREAGSFTGIYEVMKDVGIMIGPVFGGYLTQTIGFVNTFMLAGYLSIISSLLLVKKLIIAKP